MEKQAVETQVKLLLKQYGYSFASDTYVDIIRFVRRLGFTVGNAVLGKNEIGFLAIHPDGGTPAGEKIIGVNTACSLEWKRFVIAHEFAHSVLYYRPGQIYLHRQCRKTKKKNDTVADYFADALLMPRESFRRVYLQFAAKEWQQTAICMELSAIFKVPLARVSGRISDVMAADPLHRKAFGTGEKEWS